MNIVRILQDMKETLSRDNERYAVKDSQHIEDLITGYKWHFYPNGTMHVTKGDAVVFDGSQLDDTSMAYAKAVGNMIRQHFAAEFIADHAKLYEQTEIKKAAV